MKMYALAAALVLAVTASCMAPAYAAVDANVSVVSNTYTKAADATLGYQLRVGTKDQPVYLWGEMETTVVRVLGQPMALGGVTSAGIGAVKRWGDVEAFIELGYGMTDMTPKSQAIQDEMVYTVLLNNHENIGRPAPASDPALRNSGSLTSYEISDGYVGRIGVRYRILPHLHLLASYRVLSVTEHMEWWDVEGRANGGGWWQESNRLNLNSAQFGIVLSY